MADQPGLGVVIVSYRNAAWLPRCLAPLLAMWQQPITAIILVDNASDDGGPEWAQNYASQIQVIAADHNYGYAWAVNQGVAALSTEHIVLINADVLVEPQTLPSLAFDHPEAICGPLHRHLDGSLQQTWGGHPTLWTEFQRRRREHHPPVLEKALSKIRQKDPQAAPVGWLSGSCLAFTKRNFAQVGPWDETFLLYWEDCDWCLRAASAGVPLLLRTDITVRHGHGASVSLDPAAGRQAYRRSQQLFLNKHASWMQRLMMNGYLALRGHR